MSRLIGFLAMVAVVYVGFGLLLYLLQGFLVFLPNMPGRALTATPAEIGLDFEDVRLETSDGVQLHGWYVPAGGSPGAGRGCLLFFHGNAGNISHRLDSLAIFHELGLDTLIIDYRGYGESGGRPSEPGTYLDAAAAWDHLVVQRGVRPERIVVFGRSLGGAVAAWLASRERPVAVILESSFSSGADMARRLYPFLPARLITRLRYPTAEYAGRFRSPLLVVHSRDDEIIPFAMGRAIFDAAPEPKRFLELRGDHNQGFLISRPTYVAGLREFLAGIL